MLRKVETALRHVYLVALLVVRLVGSLAAVRGFFDATPVTALLAPPRFVVAFLVGTFLPGAVVTCAFFAAEVYFLAAAAAFGGVVRSSETGAALVLVAGRGCFFTIVFAFRPGVGSSFAVAGRLEGGRVFSLAPPPSLFGASFTLPDGPLGRTKFPLPAP